MELILIYFEPSGSGSLLEYFGCIMELLFNTRDELIKVNLRHVVFFEADDNFTDIHFSNGVKATILCTLSNMELLINEKLKGKTNPFIRTGKCYIVNTSYIFQINTAKKKLLLTNFYYPQLYTLSISKEALKKLKDLYLPNKL